LNSALAGEQLLLQCGGPSSRGVVVPFRVAYL
jgi:hypothetical protein